MNGQHPDEARVHEISNMHSARGCCPLRYKAPRRRSLVTSKQSISASLLTYSTSRRNCEPRFGRGANFQTVWPCGSIAKESALQKSATGSAWNVYAPVLEFPGLRRRKRRPLDVNTEWAGRDGGCNSRRIPNAARRKVIPWTASELESIHFCVYSLARVDVSLRSDAFAPRTRRKEANDD